MVLDYLNDFAFGNCFVCVFVCVLCVLKILLYERYIKYIPNPSVRLDIRCISSQRQTDADENIIRLSNYQIYETKTVWKIDPYF